MFSDLHGDIHAEVWTSGNVCQAEANEIEERNVESCILGLGPQHLAQELVDIRDEFRRPYASVRKQVLRRRVPQDLLLGHQDCPAICLA